MERHRCKQCYRRFASGRALAGHMRSHVSPAIRSRPRGRPIPSPSASSSSPHPPANSVQEKEAPPPAFSASSAFHDQESDAESSLNRRPKRPRAELPATDEPLSSVSDASSEEDVARCLMLLSRDAWSKSEAEQRQSNDWDEVDGEEYEEGGEEDGIGSGSRQRRRSRFRCGTCRKVFRSYQALGGHRASHKRVGVECVPITAAIPGENSSGGATAAHRGGKLWECPYCYRVFGSGQALGGHKRSHLSSSAAAIASSSPAIPLPHPRSPSTAVAVAKNNSSGIDLNLPAPTEDEVELSALSVATYLSRK